MIKNFKNTFKQLMFVFQNCQSCQCTLQVFGNEYNSGIGMLKKSKQLLKEPRGGSIRKLI